MTAIFALLLLLMVGLCIDISRIYSLRAELQNAADASALSAARELNGGTGGIDDAVLAANAHLNTQGLRAKSNVAIATVEFADNLNGPWQSAIAAKATPAAIRFVKVTTQPTSTNILFASSALGVSNTQSREAVAGMSVDLDGICDFYPAAVGLLNPNPAAGTLMTLNFAQGSGSTATINDMDYIVLDVPCITGNGDVETARLSGGEPCACNNLGNNINMTPSSNFGNGGNAAGDGMNTRFDVYSNGYGNALQPGIYPPDTNINETITAAQYLNKSPLTPPSNPGRDERRIIVAPIIAPGTYPANTNGQILAWGKFFLRQKMFTTNGNCANNPPCGSMSVEYMGRVTVSANGNTFCGTGLTTPVLYR
jgi:Flp pilus assembly protein TadG